MADDARSRLAEPGDARSAMPAATAALKFLFWFMDADFAEIPRGLDARAFRASWRTRGLLFIGLRNAVNRL